MELGPILLGFVFAAIGALIFRYGDTKLDVKEGALMRLLSPSRVAPLGKAAGAGLIGLGLWLMFKGFSA